MRARLAVLDAMRGVAAIAVAQFHFELVFRPQDRIAVGYLAVDLFFLLSGFVLARAYGERLASGMTLSAFMLRRAVRLFPLYLVGLAAGMVVIHHTPLANSQPAWAPLFEIVMLPPVPMTDDMPIFPALLPAWSLFFEFYVANLLFAVRATHATWTRLITLLFVSAILLAVVVYMYGSLDIGALGKTFWGGIPRVCFSFFAGVAVERIRARHPPRIAFPSWLIIVALAACLWCPVASENAKRVLEFACVLLVFPALIYFGSAASDRLPRVGVLVGDTSYALYIIHFPLIIALAKKLIHAGQTAGRLTEILFIVGTCILALLIARFVDEPLRRWLWTRCARFTWLKTAASVPA